MDGFDRKMEGDTLVIESTGFDDRAWLSENRVDRRYGYTHSDELRYDRALPVSASTPTRLTPTLTMIDPEDVHRAVGHHRDRFFAARTPRSGKTFCVPSEAQEHTDRVLLPAAGAK